MPDAPDDNRPPEEPVPGTPDDKRAPDEPATPEKPVSPDEPVTPEKPTAPNEPATPDRPRRAALLLLNVPRSWLIGAIVAIVVILGALTVAFAVVNNDNTCGRCHVIKKEVVSYKTTAHFRAGVSCQDCHTKPGVFNYFIRNLQASTHIVEYASGHYERPITTYVGVENCVTCHPKSQLDQDIVVGNIRVNHAGLRDAGFQCVTCHAEVAHGAVVPVGSRPTQSLMSYCTKCHNGVTQPDRCSICHVNGVPKGTAQIRMDLHMSRRDCVSCHASKTFCTKCHNGLVMPHPVGWLKLHGPLVVQRGPRVCVTCHTKKDPTFCIDCHGIAMPHPADWIATHPSTAASDPSLCAKCHGSDSCVACHGVTLPHPSSFIANHFTYVAQEGQVCVKCHGNGGSGPGGCYGGQCHRPGDPIQ
jgi:nitrate/TMAO reductase-like tetraheme cytochrome c subunit